MIRWIRIAVFAALTAAAVCLLGAPTLTQQNLPGSSPVPSPGSREHTLLFVGDVMLSRGVGAKMQAKGDWAFPFHALAETLRSADLTYGSLECPISDQGRDLHHLFSFRADPRALQGLEEAGFDVVSQANNHAYDWGPAALLDSLARLRAAGIRPVGAGQNDLEAHYPVVVDLGDVKVAFLAYVNVEPREAAAAVDRPGVAWLDPERVLADIRFARPLADLIVVCPHWGSEYAAEPMREQVRLAQRMIDAGADLIVGSHPHVAQPLDQYHGRWIAYSLGNFIFDQWPGATRRGLMLKVIVRDKQIAELTMLPITINPNFQATLAVGETAGSKTAPARRISKTVRAQ
jgi:poly-gamma-glutamate capsule biosynthesis protein CapA/YwtB (metallophosphatase superfamily)